MSEIGHNGRLWGIINSENLFVCQIPYRTKDGFGLPNKVVSLLDGRGVKRVAFLFHEGGLVKKIVVPMRLLKTKGVGMQANWEWYLCIKREDCFQRSLV